MEPVYFDSPQALRAWLERHHDTASALVVGLHKRHTGRAGPTWAEVVDQALCFGWIDGVGHRVDDDRYTVRLTPRRRGSRWSDVNVRRVAALTDAGLMHPAGLAAYEARDPARTGTYAHEQRKVRLDPAYEAELRADPAAWAWFSARPPSYRRDATWWVMSAKREETRRRRLATLVADSAAGRPVPPLARRSRGGSPGTRPARPERSGGPA